MYFVTSFNKFYKLLDSRNFIYIILLLLLVVITALTLLSNGLYGGADNAAHFKYAKFGFEYPSLLLNHWAKPGYTIIISPIAQLGFMAVRIFNVIIGLANAYVLYLIVKKLNYKNKFLLPLTFVFAPVYLVGIMSANTETFFIFVTLLSIYFFISNKYALSAIIISYTVVVRPEAVVFIPLIGLALLIRKKYKYIPLLFTGFIVFSIIGFFHYKDILWLINEIPYKSIDHYGGGTGNVLHYFKSAKNTFGLPHAAVLVVGLIVTVVDFISNKQKNNNLLINKYLLIYGSFLLFFLLQIVAAWKGIATKSGSLRHLAPLMPFSAIIVLDGINFIRKLIGRYKWVYTIFIIAFIFLIVKTPFDVKEIPTPYTAEQQVTKQASVWLEENGYMDNKIYFYSSFFVVYNDLDPYDPSEAEFIWHMKDPGKRIDKQEIVIWDSHHARARGNPFSLYKGNKNFRLLKAINSDNRKDPVDIRIFQKNVSKP